MEKIFMNKENRKTNELRRLVLNMSQRLDLKSSNKYVSPRNLSFYYKWKNISQEHKNKFKIIALTWIDKFELTDSSYSVSDIQDYIKYIIKNFETLSTNHRIHIYINRINNRTVFKIKDRYKLELQTPNTIKVIWLQKKLIDKTKNIVPILELAEVVLEQCNFVDNQYQQSFTFNKLMVIW